MGITIGNIETNRPRTPLTDEEISVAISLYLDKDRDSYWWSNNVTFDRLDYYAGDPDYRNIELRRLALDWLRTETLAFYASEEALESIRAQLRMEGIV